MAEQHNYDLVIVGGGPAGLAAASNANYEHLTTGLMEAADLGGQAGTSVMIENYAGYHEGVTGQDLTMDLILHAEKFGGTDLHVPGRASGIEFDGEGGFIITDDGFGVLTARSVLIATGVQYNRHPATTIPRLLNRGVVYGSPHLNVDFTNEQIFMVGGANSAGSGAIRLAECPGCTVHMLVRGESLEDKMSAHLVEQIEASDNIQVHTGTNLVSVEGDDRLASLTVEDVKTGEQRRMVAQQLFLLIGAKPKTSWLPEAVALDDHKFVLAGRDLSDEIRERFEAECGRPPYAQETSVPGLFVAGDVRSDSIKRVANAIGEGSAAVSQITKHVKHPRSAAAGEEEASDRSGASDA